MVKTALKISPGSSLLFARADGLTESAEALLVSFMAPRLQGEATPAGELDLSLWGSGQLAKLRFKPFKGPFTYTPNGFTTSRGGLFVAQSAPALVLRDTQIISLSPARRCAWWDTLHRPAPVTRDGNRRVIELHWGVVISEQRGDDLVIAAGEDRAEAERGITLSVDNIMAEAQAYTKRCDAMPDADPLLRSMVVQGVHAGLSSARKDAQGKFAGLAAGQAYSAPARTYYRDGYWTLQILLRLAPDLVRAEIDLMAKGLRHDGEAPSGVIVSGAPQAAAWEHLRQRNTAIAADHRHAEEWWSDHFDSPLFFILSIGDYIAATGDKSPAQQHAALIKAVFDRYAAFAKAGHGLPQKPRHDRDWADNVYREGLIAYDLGLWVGALDVLAKLGYKDAAEMAVKARKEINNRLWQDCGWYADYAAPDGFVEKHLALDSLTLLRYNVADEDRARTVLDNAQRLLHSKNNKNQPWEDWGMLCVFPPFSRRSDLRSKTAFPYRYHNGADWPWLDGMYANELLRRGMPGARYPLTRWWETCLKEGWTGPVEYFSPPFGRGSLLQGWSSMPAAVALAYKDSLLVQDK